MSDLPISALVRKLHPTAREMTLLDEIERLRAEVERLRAVLETISISDQPKAKIHAVARLAISKSRQEPNVERHC